VSHTIFTRFDYAGISMLIAGSTFPPFYYGMYCYLEVFIVYEIIISVLAVTIFILSMFEWMHKAENSLYKALIYGGFGLFNVIPFSHLFINSIFFNSGDGFNFATTIPYVGLLGLSYLFGLYVYTAR
jgi:adiponectin receptor